MYNNDFIFKECGFDWLPDYLIKDNLFNVSYDIDTEVIKLYILDETKSFLYKISQEGISKQYEALKFKADPSRLSAFLGVEFDDRTIQIDTVEDNVYYLYIEEAPHADYTGFLDTVCSKFGISKSRFLDTVNRINKRQITNMFECFKYRAVSGVKVPFESDNCKLYSRPFKLGNGYELNDKAKQFMTRLYGCDESDLESRLEYLWVSSELLTNRIVLTTQYHELVH
ncbi:MAG: hypothetical protein KGZ88_05345 [Methylomicrobium sp.]|nr:hypothetical protein [Methylomicrobium sp.]